MPSFIVKFKSRNIEPEVKYSDCSRRIINTYDLVYNDKHIIEIVKTGEVNVYDKIQTYAHDNDFSKLIKNIELTGNNSLYKSKQAGFIDSTLFPTSLGEMINLQNHAKVIAQKLKDDEYTKSKGVPFQEFIKNYSEKDHYEFLKSKYEKKEVKE